MRENMEHEIRQVAKKSLRESKGFGSRGKKILVVERKCSKQSENQMGMFKRLVKA